MRETFEVEVLSNGVVTTEHYSVSDKIRSIYFSGIQCATEYETLSMSQPETFFILTNFLNGILSASENHYYFFVNNILVQMVQILQWLVIMSIICGLCPLLFFTLTILLSFFLKARLQEFLNGIYLSLIHI